MTAAFNRELKNLVHQPGASFPSSGLVDRVLEHYGVATLDDARTGLGRFGEVRREDPLEASQADHPPVRAGKARYNSSGRNGARA